MIATLAAALLLSPVQRTTTTTTRTVRRTYTLRVPTTRLTVNAGERVVIRLDNPDDRPWTTTQPITPTVRLVSKANKPGKVSTFEFTTKSAVRSTLEFRHPSGLRRDVKLTVAAYKKRMADSRTNASTLDVPTAPMPPARTVVTPDLAGKTVAVARGEFFEIRLPANRTTPYAWRAEPWPIDLVALKSATYVSDANVAKPGEPPMTGVGGTQVYRLKAIGRGTADIALAYQEITTKDVAERFQFVLEVR